MYNIYSLQVLMKLSKENKFVKIYIQEAIFKHQAKSDKYKQRQELANILCSKEEPQYEVILYLIFYYKSVQPLTISGK